MGFVKRLSLLLVLLAGCVPPGDWHDDGSGVLFAPEPFVGTVQEGSDVRVFNATDEQILCVEDWRGFAPNHWIEPDKEWSLTLTGEGLASANSALVSCFDSSDTRGLLREGRWIVD